MSDSNTFFDSLFEGATIELDGSRLSITKEEPVANDMSSIICLHQSAHDAFEGGSASRSEGADFSTVRVIINYNALRPDSQLKAAIDKAINPEVEVAAPEDTIVSEQPTAPQPDEPVLAG